MARTKKINKHSKNWCRNYSNEHNIFDMCVYNYLVLFSYAQQKNVKKYFVVSFMWNYRLEELNFMLFN